MSNQSDTDIDDVLDLIGFGYMQLLMVFTCAMITVYVNIQLMGISLISVSIDCELSISDFKFSILSIAGFVGLILSSNYAGYKTDQIGRRTMVIYSLMLSLAASLVSAIMPDFYSILFFRFLTGLCISGAGINNLTYITEYTKISLRPRVVNFMSYAVALGSMYVPALATLSRPLSRALLHFGSFKVCVWRFNLLAHCLPGLIAFLGMWILPETAKFMISVGDTEGAYNTLNRLCISNRKQDLNSFGVTSVTQPHRGARLSELRSFIPRLWTDTKMVIGKPYTRPILQVIIILSGFSAVGNGIGLWFTKMRHYMSSEDLILCDSLDYCHYYRNESSNYNYYCSEKPIQYKDGIIQGFCFFCCCVFTTFLLCCLKRKFVLGCNALLASMFGLSLNFVKSNTLQLVALVLFITLCSSSISLAGSVIMDIVPTYLRGKAAALVYMFARLAIVASSVLHGQIMCDYCLVFFNIFVDFLFVVAILSVFLP